MDTTGKFLLQMYATDQRGWRFNRKYWNKVAWFADPISLLQMLDYTQNTPTTNSHWHCLHRAAKARGMI
jgi:hypothetical protein